VKEELQNYRFFFSHVAFVFHAGFSSGKQPTKIGVEAKAKRSGSEQVQYSMETSQVGLEQIEPSRQRADLEPLIPQLTAYGEGFSCP